MATTWYVANGGTGGGTGKGSPLYTGTDGVNTSGSGISSATATWTSALIGQAVLLGGTQINLISAVAPQTSFTVTTTSASTIVTSAALFTSSMVGQLITGPGIPANTYISAFTNSSSVTISAAASTGFGTGTATLYPCITVTGISLGTSFGSGTTGITWAIGGAMKNLNLAGGTIAAGDTVYVAPGVNYACNLTPQNSNTSSSSTGTSGSQINIIGDVTGANFSVSAGEVIVTLATSATAGGSSGSNIATSGVNGTSAYINYSNLTFNQNGASFTGGGANNITFTDCTFFEASMAAGTAVTILERCQFFVCPVSYAITAGAGATTDAGLIMRNCQVIGGTVTIVATGSSGHVVGGVRIYSSSIFSTLGTTALSLTGTYLSGTTGSQCELHNSVVYGNVSASVTSGLLETYNAIQGTKINTTGGTGSTGISYAGWDTGQALKLTGIAKPLLTPNAGSVVLGVGAGTGANYPTVDILNRPRPSGGGSANATAGAVERHDFAIQDTTTYPTGYTSSAKLVGPGDQYLLIPVDPIAHQFSVQVYQGSGYTGTSYATATILANGELGIGAQTVTASSTLSAWQTLTFSSITPSKAGFITLQVTSYDTSGTGTLNFGAIL